MYITFHLYPKIGACCLTEKVPAVQANGAVKLAVPEMAKQAPARSHAQVFKHASCYALSCTLGMNCGVGVSG